MLTLIIESTANLTGCRYLSFATLSELENSGCQGNLCLLMVSRFLPRWPVPFGLQRWQSRVVRRSCPSTIADHRNQMPHRRSTDDHSAIVSRKQKDKHAQPCSHDHRRKQMRSRNEVRHRYNFHFHAVDHFSTGCVERWRRMSRRCCAPVSPAADLSKRQPRKIGISTNCSGNFSNWLIFHPKWRPTLIEDFYPLR